MRRKLVFGILAIGVAFGCAAARAQPDKPVTLVVGYSAGGSADFVARTVAPEMARRIGRPVIVENVVGASGMLAVRKALAAPADGQTIYMGGTDTVVVPMVNAKVKHNWEKDFQPLGRMTTVPMVFAVPADSTYSSLAELVAGLRKKPQEGFNFATPGIGTMQHFYGALINKRAHVAMQHIPYRGGAQIANDLAGKQVESAVLVLSTAMPFLKEGRIKALSVSDSARVPQLPGVPRIGEEEGFAGLSLPLWQALFVKAGTPAVTVAAYEKALQESLAQPEVRATLEASGITAAPMPGKELNGFIRQQQALYRDIVSAAKISVE